MHVEGEEPLSFQYGKKNWAPIKKLSVLHNGIKSHGKWIGLIKLSKKGSLIFKDQIKKFIDSYGDKSMLEDFINYLIKNDYEIMAHYCIGKWIDIDNKKDLLIARDILKNLEDF